MFYAMFYTYSIKFNKTITLEWTSKFHLIQTNNPGVGEQMSCLSESVSFVKAKSAFVLANIQINEVIIL